MPRAFILANVEIHSEDIAIKNLRRNGFVEEVYVVNSPYDLIIRIKSETMEDLKEAIHNIRAINQVEINIDINTDGRIEPKSYTVEPNVISGIICQC